MSYDLTKQSERKKLIETINSNDNKSRKAESLRQQEIYQDRLFQYVKENLEGTFDAKTVKEMPIISSVNLVKRIIKEEASIYRESPKREYIDADEDQTRALNEIYKDMKADKMLQRANEMFKLQSQSHLQIIPKNGSYIMRVLMSHHIDVIENQDDPERLPIGFVISTFDKEEYLEDERMDNATGITGTSNVKLADKHTNTKIADRGDYKGMLKKYVVWTRDYEDYAGNLITGMNFIMNEEGHIVSDPEKTENPLRDFDPYMLPFINIADNRSTFEYWCRQGQSLDKFCIDYNTTLTDIQNIVRLQGYSQAVISGDASMMPENMNVGVNSVIKLPIDPNSPVATNFEFVSPNPDLSGSIKFLEMLLANFLTSRGIDPKIISNSLNGGQTFASGYERLLSEISNFSASREDISLFEDVEQKLYEVLNGWNFVLKDSDQIKDKFKFKELNIEDSPLVVDYYKPELMQTRNEKVERLSKEMELGFISRVDAIMEIHGLEREDAIEKAKSIDEEDGLLGAINVSNQGSETDREGGFSGD